VTSSPPATEGGHLVIGRSLVQALEKAGHRASLLVTPDYGFGRNLSTYWANWRTDVGKVDQVISLRYPSYAVRHRPHVCWLNHTVREYYDLWPKFSTSLSPLNTIKENLRRMALHTADSWLLRRQVDRICAQSSTVQRRLRAEFDLPSEVVLPPAPQRAYRCDGYGDYILAVSRLVPLKRIDLLVRALAEPQAQHVRAVVIGDGERRKDLEQLAADLDVASRIRFLGQVGDELLVEHLARCRAVCFTPFDEDYGFVAIEAFTASKPVVTCRDSGGPLEIVADGVNGFVVDPAPAAVAEVLARLSDDRALAARLGAAGRVRAESITWKAAIERLVIV
jgi:glycosyltransferase involved in cell wall biosynthesis